jgi:hypothetical protein
VGFLKSLDLHPLLLRSVLLEDELFGGLEFCNNLHILAELHAAGGSSAIAVAVIDEVSTIVFHEVVYHNR